MNPLVSRVIAAFDPEKTDHVTFRAFVRTLSRFSPRADPTEKLQLAFNIYDIDGDGLISKDNLFRTLSLMVGDNLTDEQLQQIVDKTVMEADLVGDGCINFEEFVRSMRDTDIGSMLTIRF